MSSNAISNKLRQIYFIGLAPANVTNKVPKQFNENMEKCYLEEKYSFSSSVREKNCLIE